MASSPVNPQPVTERAGLLEAELLKQACEIFPARSEEWHKILEAGRGKPGFRYTQNREVYAEQIRECTRRLVTHLGDELFREAAADIFFDRFAWRERLTKLTNHATRFYPVQWCEVVIDDAIRTHRPRDLVARIERRIDFICRNAYQKVEGHNRGISFSDTPQFSEPTFCVDLLLECPDKDAALRVVEKVVNGSFNYGPFEVSEPDYIEGKLVPRIRQRRSYDRFLMGMFSYVMRDFILGLAAAGRLTEALVEKAARNVPNTLNQLCRFSLEQSKYREEAAIQTILHHVETVARRLTQNFDADWQLLLECHHYQRGCSLERAWYLLQAAHHHQRLKMKKLVRKEWHYYYQLDKTPELAIVHLADAKNTVPSDPAERQQVVTELKKFPQNTLEALLPLATNSVPLLCEALGWTAAEPLIDAVFREACFQGYDNVFHPGYDATKDAVTNAADPTNGIIDLARARELIAGAGKPAEKVLDLLAECNKPLAHSAMLYGAAGGFNSEEVQKGVAKRNQTAVKAFGLLPLKKGKSEALQRYLDLKEFEKGSNEFGPERRANERAAVQVGLANLAQVAAFPDALRLEWAMEAQLTQEQNPIGRVWKEGEHRAELVIRFGEPELTFYSKDKPLKAAPAAMKSTAAYEEMKELLGSVKQQFKRLKTTFEQMMCTHEPLSGLDLQNLTRLPVAAHLISKLVLAAGSKERPEFGYFHGGSLVDFDQRKRALQPSEALTIAHPHTLFEHGVLAAWQAAIVHFEWSQPFKQVFREVYLATEEERAAPQCERFAGQTVRAAVASRLLSSRGWELKSSDSPEVIYFDRRQQLLADWKFPDAHHYLAEQETVGTGPIRFMRAAAKGTGRTTLGKLTPGEVPPIFFSEVMRDADLVCSVAAAEAKTAPSPEVRARRAEAIRAVLAPMQMDNVSFSGDSVLVRGKLANYRVSCHTAAITREPDHSALIFSLGPRMGAEKLFIPFADEEDPILSQVVTAVVILAHDDQIKDKDFLKALGVAPTKLESGNAGPRASGQPETSGKASKAATPGEANEKIKKGRKKKS